LLLLAESSGNCRVYDPSEGYQVVLTFEPVEGRLSPVEI